MADKPINLVKLKDEIHNRKAQKGVVSANLGEAAKSGAIPKDVFLHELATSVLHGQESQATAILKDVDHRAAVYSGEARPAQSGGGTMASELGRHGGATPTATANPNPPVATGGDRDHLLFEELERKKREMLSGGAANLALNPQAPQAQQHQQGGFITENKLYEAVDEVIKDKFAHIVEHAMKDSIVDIYAVTRMKEVINENRDVIKEMVVDIIRDLQAQSKKTK